MTQRGSQMDDPAEEAEQFRAEVRVFLEEALRGTSAELRAGSWMNADITFSRRLADRGWIGMTWPSQYGGSDRSNMLRYVLLEEMLAAGAPVGAHWIGDRQVG